MCRNARTRLLQSWLCVFLLVISLRVPAHPQTAVPAPPPTPVEEKTETIHGVSVSDPYQWLEDSSSPRVRSWIAAQQKYTASLLDQRPDHAAIRSDVLELADIEEAQRILYRAGHYYILKKVQGQEIASLFMRQGETGKEELLIDPKSWSADQSDTMDLLNASQNGKIIAYSRRHGGRDQVSIHFYDVEVRRDLPDELPEARYIYWAVPMIDDGARVFYAKFEDAGPRLYQHKLGTKPEDDQLIFGSDLGPEMILLPRASGDGSTLLIHVLRGASGSVDVYLKDLRKDSAVKPVVRGIAATFFAEAAGGHVYIQTNWEASRGRIMVGDLEQPEHDRWKTLIPEAPGTIENFYCVGGKLLVNYMKDVHSELALFDANGKHLNDVVLPGLGSVTAIDGEWSSAVFCFSYTSFQTPTTFFSYSLETGTRSELSVPKIPSRLADVEVEQVWYSSKDGTKVPMFLAHKKNLVKNGNAPVLLYGYGGFNWAQLPAFTPEEAVWLERGGIYAVANIRGGNEFGEAWHEAGMLEKKQNSFDDFIAAAQWLFDQHYTNPSRIAIQGLSNGGLLVTAAITQKPTMFAAAIGRYPLIDMVRYERFSIARWWIPEYGSASDPSQFKVLYSYSPYHHVLKGTKYPAVLLITGDGDTRVDPAHARKMTAMLQNATTSDRPTLLLYDTKSGHSGTLSTEAEVEQTTAELSFLEWQLHVVDASGHQSSQRPASDP
jgi:prolyl oligopeptidase